MTQSTFAYCNLSRRYLCSSALQPLFLTLF